FVTGGEVVGIDTSDTLLDEARKRSRAENVPNVRFEKIEATSKSLETATFDFAYARLVVQHFSKPVSVFRNIRRILKPGGTFFIEDTDRDWMALHPAPKEWTQFYRKVKQGQKRQGGDPRSGRKLATHLAVAGFENISVSLVPVKGDNE